MNKSQFIAAMEAQLIRLPKADRDDILNDYESHFVNGVAEGRSEEEVSAQLGDPVELAAVYLENLPEGSKGAPYIPEAETAEASAEAASESSTEDNGSAWRAAPGANTAEQAASDSNEPSAAGIIAVVLLSVFAAVPILWTIIGAIIGAFGVAIGAFAGTVALVTLGIGSMGLSVTAGVGLILLGVAIIGMGTLALFLGILGIKGTIWLVKWYIDCCKKMIGGTDK